MDFSSLLHPIKDNLGLKFSSICTFPTNVVKCII